MARDAWRMLSKARPATCGGVGRSPVDALPGSSDLGALHRSDGCVKRCRGGHESRLASCVDGVVTLDRADIAPYRSATIVWTAGNVPSPLVPIWTPLDDRARVVVDAYLAVPGVAHTYVIGDAA